MFDKLKSVEKRYNDLNQLLSDPKIISQQSEFQKYAREQSELAKLFWDH
jgi:peptide chain release factor 1